MRTRKVTGLSRRAHDPNRVASSPDTTDLDPIRQPPQATAETPVDNPFRLEIERVSNGYIIRDHSAEETWIVANDHEIVAAHELLVEVNNRIGRPDSDFAEAMIRIDILPNRRWMEYHPDECHHLRIEHLRVNGEDQWICPCGTGFAQVPDRAEKGETVDQLEADEAAGRELRRQIVERDVSDLTSAIELEAAARAQMRALLDRMDPESGADTGQTSQRLRRPGIGHRVAGGAAMKIDTEQLRAILGAEGVQELLAQARTLERRDPAPGSIDARLVAFVRAALGVATDDHPAVAPADGVVPASDADGDAPRTWDELLERLCECHIEHGTYGLKADYAATLDLTRHADHCPAGLAERWHRAQSGGAPPTDADPRSGR